MSCPKCRGLLVEDWFYEAMGQQRCVNCGLRLIHGCAPLFPIFHQNGHPVTAATLPRIVPVPLSRIHESPSPKQLEYRTYQRLYMREYRARKRQAVLA